MRTIKFIILAVAALTLGFGPATALELSRHIEAPGLPPAVWEFAGGFCAIKDWHPLIADCQETKEGDVTYRTLTLKDTWVRLQAKGKHDE